jgi:carbon storage regulator
MLVLSRKAGQTLVIAENIVVTILEIDGDRVKVGVKAPRQIAVLRGELHAEVRRENILASAAVSDADQLLTAWLQLPQSSS